jgi:uncharacterized OB-fold protein
MTAPKEKKELIGISSGDASQPFNWSVGRYGSKFLHEMRDNKKIIGIKCPKCKRVYTPVRKVCGRCYVAMDELVPLSDEGTIECCTIIQFGFVDPDTGVQRPVPYGYAFIKPDGADTLLTHFLDSTDPEKVKVGARVKAVFEEKRTGSLMDIKYFTLL